MKRPMPLALIALLLFGTGWGSPKLTLVHPDTVPVNDFVLATLHVSEEAVDLAGYGFTVEYDPAILTLLAIITTSTFSSSYAISEICMNIGVGESTVGQAHEELALCRLCGEDGVDGEGDLATIWFLAIAPGTSPLTFTSSDLHERSCGSFKLNEILHLTEDSSVTVQ